MKTIRILLVFLAIAIPAVVFGQVGMKYRYRPTPVASLRAADFAPVTAISDPGYWPMTTVFSDYYWVMAHGCVPPEEGLPGLQVYWGLERRRILLQ